MGVAHVGTTGTRAPLEPGGVGEVDPFDVASWPMPVLAVELEELATSLPRRDRAEQAAEWAAAALVGGATPAELCEAALWCGMRNTRTEGRGPLGLVTHSVLAAAASRDLPGDERSRSMAAAQLVAYTAGAYRGGVNDPAEGPSRLGWYEPSDLGPDPVDVFLELAGTGQTELSDHAWLAAAAADPVGAEQALISLSAGGYPLNEHKVVYPAQLRDWLGDDAPLDPVLFRPAARYAGNHLQHPDARTRRADSMALAEEAGTAGSQEGHDLGRVSLVATGLAVTPTAEREALVIGSLQDRLDPGDLALAVALLTAARFAATSFDPTNPVAPVGPVHSCTGADAVARCIELARSDALQFELALCAPLSPTARRLAAVAGLVVPPSDDGALDDLMEALVGGDPDGAAEAAAAVPVDDDAAVTAAWGAVAAAAARDQWMVTHAVKHTVAMHRQFHRTAHPARAWFLAAAARTAGHVAAVDQPIAALLDRRLG